MNPRLEIGHVRFEPFVDSDEETSEPLADCWLYLFWYTLRGEGAWTDEIYVDPDGRYHSIDLTAHKGKDERPHSPRGTSKLLLPFSDVRRGEAASFIHVPYVSPFQIPWARLPAVPPGKTLGTNSSEFKTLFKWLSDQRDILGSACVWEHFVPERGVRVARFRSPLHRALALSWDLAVTQGKIAAELRSNPEHGKLLVLHHAVDGFMKSGKGARFIDKDAFNLDKAYLTPLETLQEAVDDRGKILARYLDGKAFHELTEDMIAAGGRADGRFMEALAPAYDVLPSTSYGDAHLKALFERHDSLLSDKNYKQARKSMKAIWSFLKAAIKVATDPKMKPLRKVIVLWAEHVLPSKIKLKVDDHGLIHANLFKGFEELIIDHELAHKAFILIDAYNLVVAIKDWQKERKTSGMLSPKTFSVASATFSLLGTTAGWRESVLKKALKKAEGDAAKKELEVQMAKWATRKNIFGVVGNVADTVGSTWQAFKEFDLDDTNAGAAQIVCAAGAAIQVVGYALAFCSVAAAPVVLAVGAIIAVIGIVLFVMAENDDIENWMNHCWWGMARNDKTTAITKWSEGSLELFHKDLGKQMRALNWVFFDFTLAWDFQGINLLTSRDKRELFLRVTFAHLPDGARMTIKVVGRDRGVDHVVREEGVWSSAQVQRDAHGQIVEMFEAFPFQYDELVCECRLDIYGDGMQLLPPAEQEPRKVGFHVPLIERIVPVRTSA